MGQEKQWMEFEPVYYDELTGILNKRFINNAGNLLSGNISLTFFDIDNFKYINDRYGHFAGDKVIQEIGMLLKNHSQKDDYPLRFGGDEFIVISANKNAAEQETIIESIRKYVASRPFIVSNKAISVTLSFGIAEGSAYDVETILQNADFALYCSKEKGKNCTTIYTKRGSTGLYMTLKEEREIKKSIAGEKNVIIKGGFKSGKSSLLKKLKSEFPKIVFIELDDFKEIHIEGQCVIFYNPAVVSEDKDVNRFLHRVKQKEYDEFTLSSFSKDEIVRFLELAGKTPTLFTVNYLDLATNGNPFLVSRSITNDLHSKFETLTDYPAEEEISCLSDGIIEALKRINHLGLNIISSEIVSERSLYRDIMFLINLGLLAEKNHGFAYTFPPLFFHFADENSFSTVQKKMLEIARKKRISRSSGDSALILATGTDLYNYGDMEEALDIINLLHDHTDESHALKARIYISQTRCELADKEIENIKNKTVYSQIKVLKAAASAGNLEMEKTDDQYTNILYMNYCLRTQSFDMVEEIEKRINQAVLTEKEHVSYLSNLANYHLFRQREDEAMECFLKCEEICREELFLADLGKIYMQMGNMFDQKDSLIKALEYFNKAMEIFPYANMSSIIWSINLNIGVTYLKLGEFSKSLDMFSSLLAMERENQSEFYRIIIYNNLSDAYIRMFEWDNAEYYNEMVLNYYREKSSVPDFAVFQSRKISLAKKSSKWLKLDYFNKDDIISILDLKVLDFLTKNQECSLNRIKDFISELLLTGNNEEMLYKAELITYICYILREDAKIREYLLEAASMIFLSLDMTMRDNILKQSMEVQ